jgi:hypothetical protein
VGRRVRRPAPPRAEPPRRADRPPGPATYAIKETQEEIAFREYRLLRDLQRLGLPAVVAAGVVTGREDADGEELPARC